MTYVLVTVDKAAQHGPAHASATTTDSEQHEAPDFAAPGGHLELGLARAVPTVPEAQHLWACLSELAAELAAAPRVRAGQSAGAGPGAAGEALAQGRGRLRGAEPEPDLLYALALMATYFLQVRHDFGLPLLSTQLFDGSGRLPAAPRWECRGPAARGACGSFAAFYARELEWGREVVSVRLGRRCRAGSPEFTLVADCRGSPPALEDPFLTGMSLSRVLGLEQEAQLQASLRAARPRAAGGRPATGLGRRGGGERWRSACWLRSGPKRRGSVQTGVSQGAGSCRILRRPPLADPG
ncbi:unnamed protein product [Prorocentrum cordatum]|uniref:Uncharacterized protein n=1 Tax=Prorocentrum cordatum TaxID=2364126 RepID=A0ABN9Q4C6_9DINO|nr:unnamed protein product [Polarella glacialis]